MILDMEAVKTLQQAIQYFSDEQVCIDAVAEMRWLKSGPKCPDCEAPEPYYIKTQKRWKCRACRRQFSVKVGTIFEDSPISLCKWLPALWLLVNDKNGVSSWELHRALGVTQKSAWFMLHRLRLAVQDKSLAKLPSDGGPIEIDETFIGGKARNMHKEKRLRLSAGRGLQGGNAKTIVMGMLQRGGKVKTCIIPERNRSTMHAVVRENVEKGASVMTDELHSYYGLSEEYIHEIINHMEAYARGHVSTNGIENFWCLLKRMLSGTYVSVEPFHLFRYLDEEMFRYNNRATKDNPLTDSDRFVAALAQVAGKRLTYKELTGKTGSEATF
jgi:transposase-like protein